MRRRRAVPRALVATSPPFDLRHPKPKETVAAKAASEIAHLKGRMRRESWGGTRRRKGRCWRLSLLASAESTLTVREGQRCDGYARRAADLHRRRRRIVAPVSAELTDVRGLSRRDVRFGRSLSRGAASGWYR